MPVNQINAFEAPAINFVKNCLRHDRDPVLIYPEPDDFEDFTLKAGLIGVMWMLEHAIEDLQLLRQRLEADGWSPDALPLQLMWVTRHPMTEAPDGSEEWDVTVSLDELVDLYEVLTELQQCSSADRVLPILASMLNQGSWATLEPETTVWLPEHLLRNVRPGYIMDEERKSERLMDGLWELANQVLTYASRDDVPRDVRKLLKRTSRRLDGLLETTEMVGQR